MSVPSKILVLEPPMTGAQRFVIGPDYFPDCVQPEKYVPYYHIPDELVERFVKLEPRDKIIKDLLAIIEGEDAK